MPMMRPLLLTPEVTKAVKVLIEKAGERPTKWEDTKRMVEARANGQVIEPKNDDLTIDIPRGYRVTYTHEYQREDLVCRHISISAIGAKPNTGPNPAAVVEIIKLFGFKNPLGHAPAWVSEHPDKSLIIEIIEPLDGNLDHLRSAL